jgi:hypothetical protein
MGDDKVEKNPTGENQPEGTEIKDLIIRAVQDPDFKALLIKDPDKAIENYKLTEVQKMLIKTLGEEDLNKLTPENLEEYFSADAAVYTPDIGDELLAEKAEEDDI